MAEDYTTIREVIEMLTELADALPSGPDASVEFGICDGENLQLIDKMDVGHYTDIRGDAPARVFVMFRGHVHPGTTPGRLLRDAAADVDQELRDLTDGPGG